MNHKIMPLNEDDVRKLFDIAYGSMDAGSGFLDSEEVGTLRTVADMLGIPREDGTPSLYRASYAHNFQPNSRQPARFMQNETSSWIREIDPTIRYCDHCNMEEDHIAHTTPISTDPTQTIANFRRRGPNS